MLQAGDCRYIKLFLGCSVDSKRSLLYSEAIDTFLLLCYKGGGYFNAFLYWTEAINEV